MSAGSFKLNLVRSSGSEIKSREWGKKENCVVAGLGIKKINKKKSD